ncbi:MAG TPA: hypothetical protein VN421_02680, partial [Pseudoflavonifractor sp.]|nr:hypothetical protein [Pseudoflavonifractor sp.]
LAAGVFVKALTNSFIDIIISIKEFVNAFTKTPAAKAVGVFVAYLYLYFDAAGRRGALYVLLHNTASFPCLFVAIIR